MQVEVETEAKGWLRWFESEHIMASLHAGSTFAKQQSTRRSHMFVPESRHCVGIRSVLC